MTRLTTRLAATALVVAVMSSTLHAQFVVFDPSNYAQAVLQVLNLVSSTWMLQRVQRLPSTWRAVSRGQPGVATTSGTACTSSRSSTRSSAIRGRGIARTSRRSTFPTTFLRLPVDLRRRLQTAPRSNRRSCLGCRRRPAGNIRLNGNNLLAIVQACG
jgi:hypothetical protein